MGGAAKAEGRTEHKAKVKVPWFIFLFIGASVLSTYVPHYMSAYMDLNRLGKAGLTATLFLIGTSLSKKILQAVGIKPFLQGVILWIVVAAASLVTILRVRSRSSGASSLSTAKACRDCLPLAIVSRNGALPYDFDLRGGDRSVRCL